MRKLIMLLDLTLDGFYVGPNEEFDWFTNDPDLWRDRVEQFSTIDTVLLGRKNYESFLGYWPGVIDSPDASETDIQFSRWLDDVPKIVFSKTLDTLQWQNARLATEVTEEISNLKAQPGNDILIMNSSSIAQACMTANLLDEYWLTIHPVALGEGRALFNQKVGLDLLDTRVSGSGQVFLHYATARV